MGSFELSASLDRVTAAHLVGFFEGWPRHPTPEQHLDILRRSTHVILGWGPAGDVAGFITCISDGVFAAYIPLLEVKPVFRHQGLGSALVRTMLARLDHCYMVDLVCDPEMLPFYESLGMVRYTAAMVRNRHVFDPRVAPALP